LEQVVAGSQALAQQHQPNKQQAQARRQRDPLQGLQAGSRAAARLLQPQAQHLLRGTVQGPLGAVAGSQAAAKVRRILPQILQAPAGPSLAEGHSRQLARRLQQLLRPQGLRQHGRLRQEGSRLLVQGHGRLRGSSLLAVGKALLAPAKLLHSGQGCSRLSVLVVPVELAAASEAVLDCSISTAQAGVMDDQCGRSCCACGDCYSVDYLLITSVSNEHWLVLQLPVGCGLVASVTPFYVP
jgi:hypothetical protein